MLDLLLLFDFFFDAFFLRFLARSSDALDELEVEELSESTESGDGLLRFLFSLGSLLPLLDEPLLDDRRFTGFASGRARSCFAGSPRPYSLSARDDRLYEGLRADRSP